MRGQLETPVALIFFTRPDTFEQVFSKVREARPKKLFLIQDGPRENRPDDIEKIMECRKIAENIDWECEVFKNYSDTNLGCGERPASGITWVFENVDRAIILEDDCVPCETFFDYCEELLERYKDDERIAYISGLNHFAQWDCGDNSYFFTKTGAIWGWATWKRAWSRYDYYVNSIKDDYVKKILPAQVGNKLAAEQRMKNWETVNALMNEKPKLSFWDAQWGIVKFLQNQLVIVPKYNQISNIGFGADSTHAQNINERKTKKRVSFFYIPTKKLELPIKHPDFCCCDYNYDNMVNKNTYGNFFVYKIKNTIKKILGKRAL